MSTVYDDRLQTTLKHLKGSAEAMSHTMPQIKSAASQVFRESLKETASTRIPRPNVSELLPALSELASVLDGIKGRYSFSTAAANALSLYNAPATKEALELLRYAAESNFPQSFALASEWSKLFPAFESQTVMSCAQAMTAVLPQLDTEFLSAAAKCVMPDFEISENDSLLYEGTEYSSEALSQEFSQQIESASSKKLSLREKLEQLKKKYWLLLLVLKLLLFLPAVPQTFEFYKDVYEQIVTIQQETSTIAFTVRERSYLREDSDGNAAVIIVLKYDTALEILDDIPRWYQVKYTDENGEEIIGWISKISVETGG